MIPVTKGVSLYLVECDECDTFESTYTYTKCLAVADFRRRGWLVKDESALCPDCRKKKEGGLE